MPLKTIEIMSISINDYTSLKEEFNALATTYVEDEVLTQDNKEDWHHLLFNEGHYIIGYYNASEKLKEHNIDVFEAISTCIEYEKENFGEVSKTYDNAEMTVNMLAYVLGQEWLYNGGEKFIETLMADNE